MDVLKNKNDDILEKLPGLLCTLTNKHTTCKNNCASIVEGIEKNELVDFNKIFENLMRFLQNNPKCCTVDEVNNLINKISDLIDLELLSINTISILRHLNSDYLDIFKNQINKKNSISSKLFSNILLLQNKGLNDYIIDTKLEVIDIIPYHIELLCSNPGITNNESVTSKKMIFMPSVNAQINESYINKLSNQNPSAITKTAILYAIMGNHKIELIDSLIQKNKNLILDEDYLIISCYSLRENLIEYFLNNKIEVNNKCFHALFSEKLSANIIKTHESFINYFNNSYPKKNINTESLKIIQIFQKYNYIFTYKDAEFLISHKIEIPSFEKYNIEIDDKFINLCKLHNFFPNYGDKLKNLKAVQIFQNYYNLADIKAELNKLDIIPNQECLYKACEVQSTIVIKYLIGLGLNIDEKCLEASARYSQKKNQTFILILDEFIKNSKKNKNDTNSNSSTNIELEDKVKKLENRIKELEEELQSKKEKTNKNNLSYLDKNVELSLKQLIKVPDDFAIFFGLENNAINLLSFKKVLLKYFKDNNYINNNSFEIILDDELVNILKYNKYDNKINLKDLDKFCKFILSSFISAPG